MCAGEVCGGGRVEGGWGWEGGWGRKWGGVSVWGEVEQGGKHHLEKCDMKAGTPRCVARMILMSM